MRSRAPDGEAAGDPRHQPYPREAAAGLGDEHGDARDRTHGDPGQHELPQLLCDARPALRFVEPECRKDRDDQHGRDSQKEDVELGRGGIRHVQQIDDAAHQRCDDRIARAQDQREEGRMGLEDGAAHRGLSASRARDR